MTPSAIEAGRARLGRPPALTRLRLPPVRRVRLSRYAFLLGVTLFMTVFGLIMVLSSSSVTSHDQGSSLVGQFLRQGGFALVGVPVMLLVSRIPTRHLRRAAWPLLISACAAQLLVVATPLGLSIGGNRNWLRLGPLPPVQPSEAIKLALVVWFGAFFAKKAHRIGQWKHFLIPVVGVAGVGMVLVLAGGDLGTTMIMAMILLGTLFLGGVRKREVAAVLAAGVVVVLLFVVTSHNRMARIASFFDPNAAGGALKWQIQNGDYALASGGVFGVGLGNSHSKWAWLPSADADFIFAVIGEELGMIGAILVLILFILLTIAFLRVYHAGPDPAARVTTAAVLVWLVGQGFVNIGVVLSVLPTLGVPLPLFSSGGTAMLSSLLAIGVVLSYAREAPDKAVPAASGTMAAPSRRQAAR